MNEQDLKKKIEEVEALLKGVLGSSGVSAPKASAMGARDRTAANPGNPQAKMTVASAFGGEAPKAAATAVKKGEHCAYNDKMQKRAAELVKSGMPPGQAVMKARDEHGVDCDAKMKAPENSSMKLRITKNMDGGGTMTPGGGGGGAPY